MAICQFGGEFVPNDDGSMSYSGGEAHAIPVDQNTTFDEFKSELAENLNCDASNLSIKYFLPSNKRTLITICNDKGLQRMVHFHENSDTVDVYVLTGETTTHHLSNKVDDRSNRIESGPITRAKARRTSKAATRTTNKKRSAAFASSPASGAVVQLRHNASMDVAQPGLAVVTNVVVQPILTAVDGDFGQRGLANSCNIIIGVGQEFNDARDFRNALRNYAVTKGFALKYVKNEGARVTVKCKANGCPWRAYASRLPTTQRFKLRKINDVHTCSGDVKDGHPQATNHWIASIVKEKLRDCPQYKPRDIANDIYRNYGITLKYHRIWRGREMALELLQDLQADAYNRLPWFCDRIRETNPGSIVTLTTTDESRFHRLFVSFHASLHGFQHGCRPLLFLDSTLLKDKSQGTLLAASSVDGDDGIFPLALAIVDAEMYDSWHWFLVELKSSLSTTCPITFVSDRNNGLEQAVPEVFEDSYHGFSLNHLIEDFKIQLKGLCSQAVKDAMIDEFKHAAYACRVVNFTDCISTIRNVSPDVATWVLNSKPEHWSNAHFTGARYNHFSSNTAELFSSWILEECDLSIIQIIDTVRCKMMEMICTRREASSMWSTALTPAAEEKLQMEMFNSRALNVLFSTGSVFEVRDNLVNIVNIENWDCTCRQWQISGLPCIHAVAVLDRTGRNVYDYCSKFFSVDSYRLTYSESINPITDIEKRVNDDSTPQAMIYPPRVHRIRRPPGRPKEKRAGSQDMRKHLRPLHCSRCKAVGHNKKTCKEFE